MTSGNEPPEGGQSPSGEQPSQPTYGSSGAQGAPSAPPPPPQQPYGQPPQQPYGQPPQQPYGQPGQGYGQPQQPAYGAPPQQPYGQPQQQYGGYGPPESSAYAGQPAAGPGVGYVGIGLAVAGAVAGVIALTALKWFTTLNQVAGKSHFSDIHHFISNVLGTQATGIGKAYFGWLAWVLLGVAVVVAIVANLPTPAASGLRALGALVSLAGIGLSFWGIKFANNVGYTKFLKHATVGFYVLLGGLVLTFVASLIPAPHRTSAQI